MEVFASVTKIVFKIDLADSTITRTIAFRGGDIGAAAAPVPSSGGGEPFPLRSCTMAYETQKNWKVGFPHKFVFFLESFANETELQQLNSKANRGRQR